MVTERVSLRPGDVIAWDPDQPGCLPGHLLVGPIHGLGHGLWFFTSPKPWHEQEIFGVRGLTTEQAEAVLNGEAEWQGPGHIFKSRDAMTGQDS